MKTSIPEGKSRLLNSCQLSNRTGIFCLLGILLLFCNELKSQNCNLCTIPSFPAVTVYQSFQTGHGMGLGVEAGTWKKDGGRFSLFIGTKMVWADSSLSSIKTGSKKYQTLLSFYLKGQYKLTSHLYLIAAPGIVNLNYFELEAGLRYVVPISRVVGIGIEPAYAMGQRQFILNANLHFALK